MSTLECKNCAEQLWRIYHFNRYKRFIKSSQELPFNINIVNVNNNERTNQFLNYLYPELFTPDSYCNITSKSYLDLFPKQQLIYLSPHAQEVMTDYDHSAAFIIGGLVDRQKIICLSNEKAKHENIRSMRLPLDDLVKTHNIQSLDDVIRVLHDLKDATIYKQFIDWEKTLRQNLPKHKLKSEGQVAYEMMKKEFLDLDDCDSYDLDENNLNV
jgi:ribonuclease P protein 1